MLFNSLDFAFFLPVIFVLHWMVSRNRAVQNVLIIIASYFFYGWWDWRFLALLLISTIACFVIGLLLSGQDDPLKRKMLLVAGLLVNLGLLAFFKYYNFFLDSFVTAFSFFGVAVKAGGLRIILPVGISFYTFQTLSYLIDVYRRKFASTNDFIAFAAFVSFFPQLVAGPIERAGNLLPQFYRARTFEYGNAIDGVRQMLWGFFKKMVIADNCGEYADLIFGGHGRYTGSTHLLGALFFTVQLYGDFSGYSDIAIGTARLFGINLSKNFAYPYFSRNLIEFWRRWHISLSTWFRDYLYVPLGGSRGSRWMTARNILIVFVVSGLWHGAESRFIVWGLLNAVCFIPLFLLNRGKPMPDVIASGRLLPSWREALSMAATFCFTVMAMIFFRAESTGDAMQFLLKIFSESLFAVPVFWDRKNAMVTMLLVTVFFMVEWYGRDQPYAIAFIDRRWPRPARWAAYYVMAMAIFLFATRGQQFVYFQF